MKGHSCAAAGTYGAAGCRACVSRARFPGASEEERIELFGAARSISGNTNHGRSELDRCRNAHLCKMRQSAIIGAFNGDKEGCGVGFSSTANAS